MKRWIVCGQVLLVLVVGAVLYYYGTRDRTPRTVDRPARPGARSVALPEGPAEKAPSEPRVEPEVPSGPRGTLRGRAHTQDGSPTQATVSATPTERAAQPVTAKCDADGAYSMDLAVGTWSLTASAPDLASDDTMVRIDEGQTMVWDFVMRATGVVQGIVTEPDGTTVQGATVRCTTVSTTTDAQGAFHLTVASGAVHVFASRPGLAPAVAEVEVPPLGSARCDLALGRPARIAGRVTDKRGNPIEGAEVMAGSEGGRGYPDNMEGVADKDGRYELVDLRDEPHWLWVRAKKHLSEWKNGVAAGTLDADFVLASGGTLAGRVVRKGDHVPIEWPIVALRFVGNQRSAWDEGEVDESQDGLFRIEGVAPGRYVVLAWAEGYATGESRVVALKEDEVVEDIVVELDAGGTLVGTVLSGRTRAPIQDVIVARVARSNSQDVEADPSTPRQKPTRTDAHGRFTMPHVPAGRQRIQFIHESYCPLDAMIELREGETIEQEFLLADGGRIFGRVLGTRGPIEGVAVGYGRMGSDQPQWVCTDAEGRYELAHVPAGQWIVGCKGDDIHGNRIEGMKTVTVQEGESVQIDFGASQGVRLSGSVRRGGRGLADVGLEFLSLSGKTGPMGRVDTDATGAYSMEGVAPGEYLVVIDGIARRFTVSPGGGDVRLDFDLPEGGFSGHVYDLATRTPIPRARVQVYRAGEVRGGLAEVLARLAGMGMSDEKGEWAVEGLDAGRYVLEVSAQGYATQVSSEAAVLEDGGRATLDVSLSAGASIELTVLDAKRVPIVGALVTLRDAASGTPLLVMETARMTSDEQGRLVLDGLPTGEVIVAVHASGRASWQGRIRVAGGQASTIEVALSVAGTLRIRATVAAGVPIADASLSLKDAAGVAVESAVTEEEFLMPSRWLTNAEGVLERGGLAPGRYTGEAVAGARRGSFEVEVVEGQVTSVDVVLR